MKIIFCLAFGLVVVVGGAWMWGAKTSASRQQTAADIQRAKNEKTVRDNHRENLDRAKAEGRNEIVLIADVLPSSTRSMEEIIRDYSLLRVRVIDKEITVDESYLDIYTWYKLEIVEVLHQQDGIIDDSPLPEDVPSRLLPLLPSETLLFMPGGAITVDDVRIVRKLSNDEFALSKKYEYLVSAKLDCGSKLVRPVAGSAGAFRIENKNLKPLDKRQQHPLVREVEQVYSNYLDNLRSDARLRPRREK